MGPFGVQLKTTLTPSSVMVPQHILEMEATSAVGLSNKVFVYRKTTLGNDVYEGIASPSQMLQVPEDEPDSEGLFPTKFRTATVQMADAQADVLAEHEAAIRSGVLRLTDSLQSAYDLSVTSIVYIGVWGTSHSTDAIIGVE
jgi:hypothetical protein